MSDILGLFLQYSKTSIKGEMQYKLDFSIASIAVFLREATGIFVIYLTLLKFNNINGWNLNEMLFLFSLLFLTYGIFIVFFRGLRDFSGTVKEGKFDRLLLRPRGLLYQLVSMNADWIAAVGHGSLGIVLFVISANKLEIAWDFKTIIYYIFSVFGGVLIQGAIFLFFSSLSFFFIETNSLKEIFFWNVRKFAGYPISIFHKSIQGIMIFVVPFAFVNYFPAQYLLRKADMANYPQYFMYIAPFVGIVLFFLAYGFWRFSIRFYKSTGN